MAPDVTPVARRRPYHGQLLAAFVAGATVQEAADGAGISRRTCQRFLASRREEIEAARADALTSALGKLASGLAVAADRLVTCARSGEGSPLAVTAARAIFEAYERIHDRSALVARLAALEAAVAKGGSSPVRSVA